MYDCEHDHYTGFSHTPTPITPPAARPASGLRGILTATAPAGTPAALLDTLAGYAIGLGRVCRLAGSELSVEAVSLDEALDINLRFGDRLLISCDLRRA